MVESTASVSSVSRRPPTGCCDMPIVNRVAEFEAEMRGWRHDLHAHPELIYDVILKRRGPGATAIRAR